MVRPCLISVANVAPLDPENHEHLKRTVAVGRELVMNVDLQAVDGQRFQEAAGFVFRRWILNILIALRYHGTLSYNDMKRTLGGLAGGSLAPKLSLLQENGFIERHETPDGGATYRLTEDARVVGSAVYALTLGKAERYHAAHEEEFLIEVPGNLYADVGGPDPVAYRDARERFAALADAFADRHREASGEHPATTAMRFTQTCVHRWHGGVLTVAEFGGGASYSDLKGALGASDAALSKALRGLGELKSIEKDGNARYRVTKWGRFDMALGCPVPALVARMWERQGRYDPAPDAPPAAASAGEKPT